MSRIPHIISGAMSQPWAILDPKFDAIVSVLARRDNGERLTAEEIRAAIGEPRTLASAPFLVGDDGAVVRQKVEYDGEGNVVSRTSAFEMASGSGAAGTKFVAVIPVYGIIAPKAQALVDASESGTGIDQLTAQFRQAVAMPNVKAIVFDFDSPGGSVYGVDELAGEIFAARDQKRIVAQVSPMAASAAYYLASQCSEIVAMPSGDVGSIGVRSMHVDVSKALEAKGIKPTHISAGKYKTEGNPYEPLSEEALAHLQDRVDKYYGMFVDAVARGRGVKAAAVRNGFGQGRMLLAADAKKEGMVDRIATLDQTLARLGASSSDQRTAIAASSSASAQLSAYEEAEAISSRVEGLAGDDAVQASAQILEVFQTVVDVPTATAENTEVLHMSTNGTPAATAVNGMDAERVRCAAITRLAASHGLNAKAAAWINSGTSLEAVQSEILTAVESRAVPIRVPEATAGVSVVADEHDKLPKGVMLGRMVRCLAGAKGNLASAALIATRRFGDPSLAQRFEAAANPQAASTTADGGFLVPENFVADVIEFLRPQAVVRSLNPTIAPLVNGSLSLPKVTGGTTATYIGENKPVIPSKIKGGQVKATAKKLAMLVPISNDLLRFASVAADTLVRDDMVRGIATSEDISFIRAAGSLYAPKGLRFWAPAANVIPSSIAAAAIATPATSTSVLLAVRKDFSALRLALRKANVRFLRMGIIMSPRTENFLMYNVTDGLGNAVFHDEMQLGKFMGYPYKTTTQIPENLGTGGDSEIYVADFADVVIADAPSISIEVSQEAAYDDGTGTLVSAFSNDQTIIRMIVEHDLVMRHDESVAVLTTVQYQ